MPRPASAHSVAYLGLAVLLLAGAARAGTPAAPSPTPGADTPPACAESAPVSITGFGAVGDGATLDTRAIQSAIDALADRGGGTLEIPRGTFLTGALFLKPGVNLHLADGAVLQGSTDLRDYPLRPTRIEGHTAEWAPALLNAEHTDHLRITGTGTLDGHGAPFWAAFGKQRRADPATTNLDVVRPRLVFVADSADVRIEGITLRDSAFWNLHLYRCRDVTVENVRFTIPDGVRCPSTDGTDIDSCQDVAIRGCTYRTDDDCICLKGSKGPLALADAASPPTERIRVVGCTFERGHGVVTLGSEATVVRDVRVERCRVAGPMAVVRLKLRPDTPQCYEDVVFHDLVLDSDRGALLEIRPWRQFFDLGDRPPPQSTVRGITVSGLRGRFGTLGEIAGNPGQTAFHDIVLRDIDLALADESLHAEAGADLTLENVVVNGRPLTLPSP